MARGVAEVDTELNPTTPSFLSCRDTALTKLPFISFFLYIDVCGILDGEAGWSSLENNNMSVKEIQSSLALQQQAEDFGTGHDSSY